MTNTHQQKALSIAVVGGSISGCLTARLLLNAGHDVQVYERSTTGLVGRGGGVATSRQVIERLQHEHLIDADFPTIPHSHLRFGKRTAGHDDIGRCPWRPELDMHCVHWSGLFQALRRGVPNARYHLGKELVQVHDDSGRNAPGKNLPKRHAERAAALHFADGSLTRADLVVFTDGFRSFGRRLMFPEVILDYRGFAVWRGVLEERRFVPNGAVRAHLDKALSDHPRLSLASQPGSFVTYLMPSDAGATTPGERIINWAVYLPVDEAELPRMMIDRDGQARRGTVPAGAFPLAKERRLKALMHEQLPRTYAAIVDASIDTQFQPVCVSQVPAHYRDRMCLVGDAAVTIQPLTGAGVYKALENAHSLVMALDRATSGPIDGAIEGASRDARGATSGPVSVDSPVFDRRVFEQALQGWSRSQVALDQRLLATGFALEQAFIWNTIDLASATDKQVQRWWQASVRFPDDYSYLKTALA